MKADTETDVHEDETLLSYGDHGRDSDSRASDLKEEEMDVNLIFKIAAVGILVSVLSQVLKHSGREEQAFLTSFAGLLLVLFWIVPYIYQLFQNIRQLFYL